MAILEFQQINNYIRVSAVDEATGIEVISLFPTNTPRSQIEEMSMRKLQYVLDKKKRDDNSSGGYV